MMGRRIWGKRLGIVGMGRIGSAVARRASAFGLEVSYHNRKPVSKKREAELEATYYESLDQMLARMDIVSVNCPHTPATFHLLSARRLKLLRRDAILVNTARGEVVDETALANMLAPRRTRGRGAGRLRERAGGEPQAAEAAQRGAAAAHGLGDGRGPHRHGREGHHQHQDLHGRPQAARTA